MTRILNFSAGPAMMPMEVLLQAQQELTDWNGSGMSVMEMSHRGKEFTSIAEQAEQDLRELLHIPDDYTVLFLQGGASMQFSMIPLNLAQQGQTVAYSNTGSWSTKAIEEASRYSTVKVSASSESKRFCFIPEFEDWQIPEDAAYLHITSNETIGGVEFHQLPDSGNIPLIADMSSTLLSRPIDVERYALIYAGAQKNIGPAGLTVVIMRKNMLGQARENCPAMMNYTIYADNASMYNTPPTYSWYLAGLVFQWLKRLGGLQAMAEINRRKSEKLYRAIDDSDFYQNPINPADRSWMNVPFTLADDSLDAEFLRQAEASGLQALKGHRSVGGMRASLYNAMPESGVDSLIDFMQRFASQHS